MSLEAGAHPDFKLPHGKMEPVGYLFQQPALRLERPITVCDQWVNRMPDVYREAVLNQPPDPSIKPWDDPYCLAMTRHYRSLIEMSQERRKPVFNLTSADGAIGSHAGAARDAKKDFKEIAVNIARNMGIEI